MPQAIAYSEYALTQLRKLPLKVRRKVVEKVNTLATNKKSTRTKVLRGFMDGDERVFRARYGDYRILFVIRESEIVVIDIGHRKEIYRKGKK